MTETPSEVVTPRLLLVDDEPGLRTAVQAYLEDEGFDVTTAEDGEEGFSKAQQMLPDVVISDVMMPRLDGYQTCALIKNNADFQSTPVIMLSSKDGLFDRAKGRIVGSDQYLTKPFSKDELLSTIRDHVKTD